MLPLSFSLRRLVLRPISCSRAQTHIVLRTRYLTHLVFSDRPGFCSFFGAQGREWPCMWNAPRRRKTGKTKVGCARSTCTPVSRGHPLSWWGQWRVRVDAATKRVDPQFDGTSASQTARAPCRRLCGQPLPTDFGIGVVIGSSGSGKTQLLQDLCSTGACVFLRAGVEAA